jgi:transglutaminase-like putative cysteine protease
MSPIYRVTHRTAYEYESDVSSSYGQLHLLPRDLPRQRCRSAEVVVDPMPELYRERADYFGNRVAYFEIRQPHLALSVTATSVVEVHERPEGFSLFGHRPWEEAREAIAPNRLNDHLEAAEQVLDSPLVEASAVYRDYALASFTPGRPLLDGVAALSSRIHTDFLYKPGSTSVTTPLAEVFEQRQGVCQDFAHLGIACLRSLGLPARYVSGYLLTYPPPGMEKLQGADASHAWISVWAPEVGWVDFDPTNGVMPSEEHVTVAYGRDYEDVSPISGVLLGGSRQTMSVAVDVTIAG